MAFKKKDKDADGNEPIAIKQIDLGTFDVAVIGITPLLLHHGNVRGHLVPPHKLTKQQRELTLKHEPYEEYRDRMIMAPDGGQTRLLFPSAAFKGAMMTAALRLGAVKTEIGQLVTVEGEHVELFGTPQIHIREVRMADMARTPDARCAPIVERWGCVLRVTYIKPMMTAQAVANLLAAGGRIAGVGDWRPEKGKGTFGQFEVVEPTDERFVKLLAEGRDVQDTAIKEPTAYNAATLDALMFYESEMRSRAQAGKVQQSRRKKPNGAAGEPIAPGTASPSLTV